VLSLYLNKITLNKTMKVKKLKYDRQDIAIEITNELINLGYVPDCTNTELENEFEVQDIVRKILKKYKLCR
jgi:hypothetical protein